MQRYYFHIEDGASAPDTEGIELENFTRAKCEAVKMAGRVICAAADEFWDRAEWSLTVADETGLTVCTLHILGTEAPACRMQGRVPSPSA